MFDLFPILSKFSFIYSSIAIRYLSRPWILLRLSSFSEMWLFSNLFVSTFQYSLHTVLNAWYLCYFADAELFGSIFDIIFKTKSIEHSSYKKGNMIHLNALGWVQIDAYSNLVLTWSPILTKNSHMWKDWYLGFSITYQTIASSVFTYPCYMILV